MQTLKAGDWKHLTYIKDRNTCPAGLQWFTMLNEQKNIQLASDYELSYVIDSGPFF